ncbi:MAG: CHAT domain-containing protein [Actinomycetota bacterium]|nr:CHAT domain-containing protein [Actinomycetota bacterium]
MDWGSVGLVLRAAKVAGPHRWRWLLVDESSGAPLADHRVELDPESTEVEAFDDLYRFLRRRADPDRRVASEAELLGRVGAWIGSVALGERIGRAIVRAAPVTVRVQVPAGAEFLAFRPWELAHVDGVPLAARGDVALVYDLPGLAGASQAKAPVGAALRMLAVFSLPTATSALALRRERYELTRLVRRVAARSRRRVELEVAQYGVTRAKLADLAESGDGWDVLHLSGHGGVGQFLLERADGSPDPVSTAELIRLLRPLRSRVKLAVVSACESAAATIAETLRWLGLVDPAAQLEAHAAQEAGQASPVGVAQALVAELGCAVVAMRYPVIDDFAVGFADALYDRVFRHSQTVDRAVAAAVPAAMGRAASVGTAISVGTPAIFGASAAGLSLASPLGKPLMDPAEQVMAGFPPEPPRFVGRGEAMAATSAALAPASGRTAVVFHGMAGAGKTACALELAYRHQRVFEALAFWSAATDPDQFGDALRLLAMALESQLGDYRFAMVDQIATLAQLENFLPRLRTLLQNTGLLLVLDNLETLLTPDGQWRDPRWAPLMDALTSHDGESRVILTSRITPAGLDPNRVLMRPVHALSRDESVLLARELPNLRTLLHAEAEPWRGSGAADPALGRRVLTLVQGHPKLLELADAAAADPARLASQLAAAEAAVDGGALTVFLSEGATALDAAQFLQTLTAWTTEAVATLPDPSRLLLQALCRIEETDRNSATLHTNWTDLWRRLGQPGDPPPLAAAVAPLAAALIAAEPADPSDPDTVVDYRIHPGIAEAIHVATPEAVSAAVDATLAAWWTQVASQGLQQERAGQDTGSLVVRAGLAAAPYLLRQHDWDTAGSLLEQARLRDSYSPVTAQVVIPSLRRIAEATGEPEDLRKLAAALTLVDPRDAETLLRRVYDQATTRSDHRLASVAANDMVLLLRDQGRLREALTLADQTIAHTCKAGLGFWTELGNQAQRLQILSQLGNHEQALMDLRALRNRMTELPDQAADNDRINPWNVREVILDIGRHSALNLGRWQQALDLANEIANVERRRGASAHETARTRFGSYGPLLALDRPADAERVLRECQEVFETVNDITMLAKVFSARADLEGGRDHRQDALALQRTALRLHYVSPEPRSVVGLHHNLANYLVHPAGTSAEQRAHRLAAALLCHVIGDTHTLTQALRALATELRLDPHGPDSPALPTTLSEVVHLVDAGEGVHFCDLVATVCPDPDTAARALADLLVTAADLPDQPPEDTVERLLTDWDPIITSVATAATTDHTPTELTDALDHHGATTDWATLVAALRRVLAGERDREQLLVGLDDVDAAIVTATLDRLPTDPRQELMTSAVTLDALTDDQAVHVLALVVDHHAPLPDPARLRELDAALAHATDDPNLQPYHRPGAPPPSDGDLVRATLTHLATSRPDLAPVINRAMHLAAETTRFEPATLAVGSLVLLALQTEIKINRNTAGEWRFQLHKKALRDSTLGRLIGQLLGMYTNPPQK